MIGLIIFTVIAVKFFDLAKANAKNKWLFAILGVGSYYLALFMVGSILTTSSGPYQTSNLIISMVIACLVSYAFYRILQLNWTKQVV